MKYHWYELRRWAEILNRFALSAGNTIGITGAGVTRNVYSPSSYLIYVNGMESAYVLSQGVTARDVRTTVEVLTRSYDLQRVADALPVLLPQLGIPVDAVGIVFVDY